MHSPGFEPGSPQPQSKYEHLDRLAMGPATESKFLAENIKNMRLLCLYTTDFFILKVIYQMRDISLKKLAILNKKGRTKNEVVYMGLFVV